MLLAHQLTERSVERLTIRPRRIFLLLMVFRTGKGRTCRTEAPQQHKPGVFRIDPNWEIVSFRLFYLWQDLSDVFATNLLMFFLWDYLLIPMLLPLAY